MIPSVQNVSAVVTAVFKHSGKPAIIYCLLYSLECDEVDACFPYDDLS